MREIKFRAYHKKEKRFYFFDLETVTQTVYVGYYHPITGEKDCELDDSTLYSEKQLYIGLKDRTEKEVYYKDCVKDEFKNIWLIDWSDEYAGFELTLLRSEIGEFPKLNICRVVDMEIIGNQFDNPELLDGK